MKTYIKIIGFSALAGVLMYIGKNDTFLQWLIAVDILSPEINIPSVQSYCFIIGLIWAGIWLPVEHATLKRKQAAKNKQFIELLTYNKDSYFQLIQNKLKAYNVHFNTRIFKPQKGIKGWWNKVFKKKVILELIEVEGISDTFHHKTLHFEVNKNEVQGLVGKCYSDPKLWIDENLNQNQYALTQQQIVKIGNIEFCSAIPIFNTDQSKVSAILSVDSRHKFNFTSADNEAWAEHMIYYGAFVDKHTNL